MLKKSTHIPVLAQEAVDALLWHQEGRYVDVTFGQGGHSRQILQKLGNKGFVYAVDRDEQAKKYSQFFTSTNFQYLFSNFATLSEILSEVKCSSVHGILADLGLSSTQLYSQERGFSAAYEEARLDMRMDGAQSHEPMACDLLNKESFEFLSHMFREYGDFSISKMLARRICEARQKAPIQKVGDLKALLFSYAPPGRRARFWARIFQSLRIAVNQELSSLKALLLQVPSLLLPKGRLVVISYHSIEDRLVKRFIRHGNFTSSRRHDVYGPISPPLTALYKKPITPSTDEIQSNVSARSAKLRVAVRN